MAQFTAAEKIAYGSAMVELRASGARVNLTEYGVPAVEFPDENGETPWGGVCRLPGWDHEDQTILEFRTAADAEGYLKAYFVDRHISGYYRRWEIRFLASRGFDAQGRRVTA